MKYEITEHLEKILGKLKKKNLVAFQAIQKKIVEIVNSENVEHYKPLSYSLKNKRRVHISKSFVLVFEYNQQEGRIIFLDYDHHDKIY